MNVRTRKATSAAPIGLPVAQHDEVLAELLAGDSFVKLTDHKSDGGAHPAPPRLGRDAAVYPHFQLAHREQLVAADFDRPAHVLIKNERQPRALANRRALAQDRSRNEVEIHVAHPHVLRKSGYAQPAQDEAVDRAVRALQGLGVRFGVQVGGVQVAERLGHQWAAP
jgi:hypothetical protein